MATIANVEMANAWDGEEGDHWTEFADWYDAGGGRLWRQFLALGLIQSDDRVLDIGCGTGRSTLDAARAASRGSALGIDLSSRMLDYARKRCADAGVTNVDFVKGDAQVHQFEPSSADIVISSFGAMFFNDRAAAFRNIGTALAPGGRLALMTWQGVEANEWIRVFFDTLAAGRDLPRPPLGAPGPFGLADADAAKAMFATVGFVDVDYTAVQDHMLLGADADDAWATVQHIGIVKGLSRDLDEVTRAAAHDALRAELKSHETDEGVLMAAGAWLITATKR